MGMGKRAAESIDFILMNEKRFQLLSKEFEYKNAVPTDIKKSPKNAPSKLPVKDRIGNFHEVSAGYTLSLIHISKVREHLFVVKKQP